MKRTIKIITTFLMGLTICLSLNAMSNRSHIQKIVTMDNQISKDYLENTTINTDCLQNVGVQNKSCKPGNDRTHEIKFENKFKKVYLSPDYHDTDVKNILSECKQTTPVTKGQNYGIFDNVQDKTGTINDDIKNRIQDWTDPYLSNLSYDRSKINSDFGISILQLKLKNAKWWSRTSKLKDISVPCAFASANKNPETFENIKDAGLNGDISLDSHSPEDGIPFTFIKQDNFRKGWSHSTANLFYFLKGKTLNPFDNDSNLYYDEHIYPLMGCYDLNKLISISSGSYKTRTVKLGINNDFFDRACKLNAFHEEQRKQLHDKWSILNKEFPVFTEPTFNDLLNMNLIDENFMNLFVGKKMNPFLFYWSASKTLQILTTEATNYAESLGLSKFDNPLIIINDLKDKMKLTLNYETPNLEEPNKWNGFRKNFNFSDLFTGVDIPINFNQNGKLTFKFDSLISNEINTTDTYVSSQDCSKIFNNSSLIESNSNNIYTLSTPCINNVRFKDNDLNFNEQYGVYDLTDDKLFNQYIELITSYGEIGDQSLLNSDQYKIHRNSKEGTITISFVINGQQYNSTYKGFKKDQQIPNINAGTLDQHLICDDLNQDKIIDLLKANNFDSQVINNLHFKITNIDNVNGEVEVLIDECKKTDLQEDYLNKSFKVVNLKPYYFEFIKKIDKSVLKRKPSSISENDYKKYFIHSSGEFNTRHMNDLKIILKSDDIHSKLDVEVSYTDLQTKYPVELKQEYNLNGNDKYHLIYYIIGGLGFLVILLVVMFFMEKRIKLRHQMPGCQ